MGPLEIHTTGQAPIIATRDEAGAAILSMYALKRNGVVRGHIGVDATDRFALLDAAGTTVLAYLDPGAGEGWVVAKVRGTTHVKAKKVLDDAGNQILTNRLAAVAHAAAATAGAVAYASATPVPKVDYDVLVDNYTALLVDVADLRTQLNLLLDRCSSAAGHGLIT